MNEPNAIVQTVKNWVEKTVIGLNFCPFAAYPFRQNTIAYLVLPQAKRAQIKKQLLDSCQMLSADPSTETTLLILGGNYQDFADFWALVGLANGWIETAGLQHEFQIAHFHPDYVFEGLEYTDAANFTNRAPYPILHLIRQKSVTWARQNHPNIHQIPTDNIARARQEGNEAMQQRLDGCFN